MTSPFDDDDRIEVPVARSGVDPKMAFAGAVAAVVIGSCVAGAIALRGCGPRELAPVGPPIDEPAPPIDEPIDPGADRVVELTLEVDGEPHDVDGRPFRLATGEEVTLVPRLLWTFFGEGVGFEHRSDLRVTVEERDAGSEIAVAAPGGVVLRITPLRADEDPTRAVVDTMTALVDSYGLIPRDVVLTRSIAGSSTSVQSFRQPGTGMTVELSGARLPHGLGVIATLYQPAGTDAEPLHRVIETLREERGDPEPAYDVRVGETLASLFVDEPKPVALGARTVTLLLRRNAMVRRTFAGVTFEHDPRLAAAPAEHGIASRVQLNYTGMAIQILVTDLLDPAGLVENVAASVPQEGVPREVVRTISGAPRTGRLLGLTLGAQVLSTEIFALRIGGKTVALLLQYEPGSADIASVAFDGIARSLRAAR